MQTGKTDRVAVEGVVRDLYRRAGLAQPKMVFWADSPLAGAYAKAVIPRLLHSRKLVFKGVDHFWECSDSFWKNHDDRWVGVESQVRKFRNDGVRLSRAKAKKQSSRTTVDSVIDVAVKKVYDDPDFRLALKGGAPGTVRRAIWQQVTSAIQSYIEEDFRQRDPREGEPFFEKYRFVKSVTDDLKDGLLAQRLTMSYNPFGPFRAGGPRALIEPWGVAPEEGQMEIGWVMENIVSGLAEHRDSIFLLFKEFAILVENPTMFKTDTLGRLHCQDGAALAYADGFEIYSWHGTTVPRLMVVGKGFDAAAIIKIENVEVRRAAIERLGWPKFIEEVGLEQIGVTVADPGNPGQVLSLYHIPPRRRRNEVELELRVLLCENATPERDGQRHKFGLTVPASINTPIEAAAWTFGVSEREYLNLQRAT